MGKEKKLYGKVSRYLLSDPEIGIDEITLLAYFTSMSFEKGHCWPSRSKIKADLGIGDRVLNKSLASLKKQGYIERHKATQKDRLVYLTALHEPEAAKENTAEKQLDRYKGLLRFGYGTVYYHVLASTTLSFGAKGIYTYLAIRMGSSGIAKTNRKKAMKDLKISDRTYSRYLCELIRSGIISELKERKNGKYVTRWYCLPEKEEEGRRKYIENHFLFGAAKRQIDIGQNDTSQNSPDMKKEPFSQKEPLPSAEENPSIELIEQGQKQNESIPVEAMYDRKQLERELARVTGYGPGLPQETRDLGMEIQRVLVVMCSDPRVRTYNNGSCVYGKNIIEKINEILEKKSNEQEVAAFFTKMLSEIRDRLVGREVKHLKGYLRETLWGYLWDTAVHESTGSKNRQYVAYSKHEKQNFTGVTYSEEFLKTLETDPEEFLKSLEEESRDSKEPRKNQDAANMYEKREKQNFTGVTYSEEFLKTLEDDPEKYLKKLEARYKH